MLTDQMICEESLKNECKNGVIEGYSLQVRIPFYRSVPLSCIEQISIKIDGDEKKQEDIRFVYNGVIYNLTELPALMNVWWELVEKAKIIVSDSRGLKEGKHNVELTVKLRWPILIPSDGKNLPNYDTSKASKKMIVSKECEI